MTINNKNISYSHKVLFLIDILHIQDINSIYGYKCGDDIVQQTHKLFDESITDKINNYFNSIGLPKIQIKFENLYTDIFSLKIYYDLDDRVIIKVKDIILKDVQNHKFYIKKFDLNIGIQVTIGCSKSDSKIIMTYAQKALAHAKENYTNYSYFDPIFFQNELINLKMLYTIKDNINKKTVEPYFQGIYNAKTHKVHKYEALMRLINDQDEILNPYAFLEKAKKIPSLS